MKNRSIECVALATLFCLLGVPLQADAAYSKLLQSGYSTGSGIQTFKYPASKVTRPLDLSCYISANQAYGKLKSGWIMVDVRAASAFAKYKVPGSINMLAHSLSSRSFLRTKKILLINDGFEPRRMVSLCHELKRKGFASVLVVFGGVAQWLQSGLPLEGKVPRYTGVASVPVQHFFQLKDVGIWHVIRVSLEDDEIASSLFPDVVLVKGWEGVAGALDRIEVEHKGAQKLIAVLIVGQDGHSYEKHVDVIEGRGYPVFFLAGGINGFQDYVTKQQAIMNHLLHPPQRRRICGY